MAKKSGRLSKIKKTSPHAKTDGLEKQLNTLPSQLMTQCRQDIAGLQQQTAKLKNELKKADAKNKLAKQKCAALAKAKSNPATNKKLNTALDDFEKAMKTVKDVLVKMDKVKEQVKALNEKQARFAALKKHLLNFTKEWKNQSHKSASPVTKKLKTRSSTVSKTSSASEPMVTEAIDTVEINS